MCLVCLVVEHLFNCFPVYGSSIVIKLSCQMDSVASHGPLGAPEAWWWTGYTAVSHQAAAESSPGYPAITGMRDSWWQELGAILRRSRGLTGREPGTTHVGGDRRTTASLEPHGGHSVIV